MKTALPPASATAAWNACLYDTMVFMPADFICARCAFGIDCSRASCAAVRCIAASRAVVQCIGRVAFRWLCTVETSNGATLGERLRRACTRPPRHQAARTSTAASL